LCEQRRNLGVSPVVFQQQKLLELRPFKLIHIQEAWLTTGLLKPLEEQQN
jgi:hypothetical protein